MPAKVRGRYICPYGRSTAASKDAAPLTRSQGLTPFMPGHAGAAHTVKISAEENSTGESPAAGRYWEAFIAS